MATEPAATTVPPLKRDAQHAMYQRALAVMPGGTDSNFRAWGEDTIYVDRGKGGMVWDHGRQRVHRPAHGLRPGDPRPRRPAGRRLRQRADAPRRQLQPDDRGRGPGDGARLRADRLGRAGAHDRLGHRGDDARDAHRPRLHRPREDREVRGPVPRRPRLRAHQRRRPTTCRSSATRTTRSRLAWGRGIPGAVADTIIPARYNNIDFLRRLFERQGEEIAAIIVEPVLGNAQGIMPKPGFHQAMRALTEEFGILLIFDEVKTGFRFARGGAAEFFGITPDLATYAKAMGNGYPAAAFGGRAEVMSVLPDKVSHGGTYAGNRVAAAAAVKTLSIITRHRRPRDHPRHRAAHPGRPARDPQPDRAAVPLHRPPVDVRDHVPRGGGVRVPRLGHHGPRAVRRDRHRHARPRRDARARLARAVVHLRGARERRHVDRIVSIFADSLDAALEARAHGKAHGRRDGGDVAPRARG